MEVDVRCSGIRMLWAGLYVGFAAACACDAGWLRTSAVVATAVTAVVLGNAVRTAALFYLEAGLLPIPTGGSDVLHAGAGLIVFAGIAAAAVVCARW
jgi:exosortase/archaeosortase family protein